MAEGALNHSDAHIAVSITGVAGPGGGDVVSPVGTVWFGWALREGAEVRCVQTAEHHLSGSRQVVRRQAVEVALEGVLALC
jgi:nicotinamide-nucleotide amidase